VLGAPLPGYVVGTYYTEKPVKKVAESAVPEGRAIALASPDGEVATKLCIGLTSRGTAATMRLFACRVGDTI
jgi:hypothetical protein